MDAKITSSVKVKDLDNDDIGWCGKYTCGRTVCGSLHCVMVIGFGIDTEDNVWEVLEGSVKDIQSQEHCFTIFTFTKMIPKFLKLFPKEHQDEWEMFSKEVFEK